MVQFSEARQIKCLRPCIGNKENLPGVGIHCDQTVGRVGAEPSEVVGSEYAPGGAKKQPTRINEAAAVLRISYLPNQRNTIAGDVNPSQPARKDCEEICRGIIESKMIFAHVISRADEVRTQHPIAI